MLVFDMRRPFQGHRAAAIDVGGIDFALRETQFGQQVEIGHVHAIRREAQLCGAELLAQCPFVEDKANVKRRGEGRFD